MFIKRTSRIAAWTLVEMMFAAAIFSLAGGAMATAYVFSLRSFQALSNYSTLDQQNREAMDRLSREIRQAHSVISPPNGQSSALTLVAGVSQTGTQTNVTYSFNNTTKQLIRTLKVNSATLNTSVILNDCSLIDFHLGMRPPNTNYGYYPTTDVNLAKMVDLTWKTSRALPGGLANTENIQTARIVIRKQKVTQ